MFSAIKGVQEKMAAYAIAKSLFDRLAAVEVHQAGGDKVTGLQEAKELFQAASAHHVEMEQFIKDLLDPKSPVKTDIENGLKKLESHGAELEGCLKEIQGFVGAEYAVIQAAVAAGEIAKIQKAIGG